MVSCWDNFPYRPIPLLGCNHFDVQPLPSPLDNKGICIYRALPGLKLQWYKLDIFLFLTTSILSVPGLEGTCACTGMFPGSVSTKLSCCGTSCTLSTELPLVTIVASAPKMWSKNWWLSGIKNWLTEITFKPLIKRPYLRSSRSALVLFQ